VEGRIERLMSHKRLRLREASAEQGRGGLLNKEQNEKVCDATEV